MIREKIKVILFDLDGVLVNMPDAHYEALNCAIGLFGEKINREEHYSFFNGLPTKKKIERLESLGRLPRGLKDFINDVKQIYTKDLIPKYCIPEYSKIIMLSDLKRQGFLLGCCSNSIKETIILMLKSAGIFSYFDYIIGNDEVKNPKPDPEIYLKAFQHFCASPSECLIVEDSPYGIQAAELSGAKVIKVRGVEDVGSSLFNKYFL